MRNRPSNAASAELPTNRTFGSFSNRANHSSCRTRSTHTSISLVAGVTVIDLPDQSQPMNRTRVSSDLPRMRELQLFSSNCIPRDALQATGKSLETDVLENASVEWNFSTGFRDFLRMFTMRTLNPSGFPKYEPTPQRFLCVFQLQPWFSTTKL